MIILEDLLNNYVELQGDVRICYYDYEANVRVIIPESEWDKYLGCNVHYIYADSETWEPDSVMAVYVEIDKEED